MGVTALLGAIVHAESPSNLGACVKSVLESTLNDSAALAKKAWHGQERYWSEMGQTKGLRFLLKDVDPSHEALERKLLFFTRTDSKQKYPNFDLFGGIDFAFNWPFQRASKKFVDHGWLQKEKQLTWPALMLLTYPVTAPLFDVPLDAIHERIEESKQKSIGRLLESDLRLRPAAQSLERDLTRIDRLKSSGQMKTRDIQEARERAWDEALKDIEQLNAAYERFFNTEAQFSQPNQRDERLDRLAGTALFRDLLPLMGESDWNQIKKNPEQLKKAEALINMRAHLFHSYDLIPHLLKKDAAYVESQKNISARKVLGRIEKSPVYNRVRELLAQKKITLDQAQKVLMQEAQWLHERFGVARILGHDELPPGGPQSPKELREMLLAELNAYSSAIE